LFDIFCHPRRLAAGIALAWVVIFALGDIRVSDPDTRWFAMAVGLLWVWGWVVKALRNASD